MRRECALGLTLCVLTVFACTGEDGGPQGPNSATAGRGGAGGVAGTGSEGGGGPGSEPGGSPGSDPVGGPGGTAGAGGPCAPELPARLTLLSDYQHLNSLRALLGAGAVNAADAAENTAQTKPFMTKGTVVNTSLVHQRASWAEGASASLATRFAEVTSCDAAKPDDACAQRFLSSFAARAFRRPVDSSEIADLMAVYSVGKTTSFTNGIKRAVEAALSSPSFMYRRELGKANAEGKLELTPHELASTISFFLSDVPPDAELTKAADSGALAQPAEIEKQVTRLLAKTEIKESLRSTLIAAWGLSNLFGTAKDPKLFPEYNPQLQASMFHETELFVQDVLWDRAAPVRELLTAKKSFVNKPVAALYGVPYTGSGDAFVPVTLPNERAGLLTQPSIMSTLARTDTTSVVARGLFVRGLLCLPKLPGPPETLASRIQDLLKADMTERERADVRKMDQTCAGCHAGIDPFGLLLESYDPLGKYRTTLKDKPIDASADVNAGKTLTGHYKDALAFVSAAAESPEFATCVGTRLLGYATQDDALAAASCQVRDLFADLDPKQVTMPALVKAITAAPALRLRAKEAP